MNRSAIKAVKKRIIVLSVNKIFDALNSVERIAIVCMTKHGGYKEKVNYPTKNVKKSRVV